MAGSPSPTHAARERPADVQAAWDAIAPGYDEFVTASHMWLAEEGLRRAGLAAGMRFLDVAAGSGALSLPAARLGARVLSTDLSPVMLERLQARARREGLEVETRVMDGHALDLDDGGFDVAGSQFGVMLFPDMPRGIRELRRVTSVGGRVLLTAYGRPDRIEFLAFLVEAIRSVRPAFGGLPVDPPPLPLQLQNPDRLRRELADAGLKSVVVETTSEALEFRSGEALWHWLTNSNPIVESVLAGLSLKEDERDAIRHALDGMISHRIDGTGTAVLTNPINIGVGTK